MGRFWDSQVSPCRMGSLSGAQLSCMSLHTFGVMKLYCATVLLARSVASSPNGRTWLMQFAELGLPLSVTSSKQTKGLCFTAYSPLRTRGQSPPLMSSWYVFQEMPLFFNRVTRCLVLLWAYAQAGP